MKNKTTVQQLIDELMLVEDKSIVVDILVGDEDGNDKSTGKFELQSEYDDYITIYVDNGDLKWVGKKP